MKIIVAAWCVIGITLAASLSSAEETSWAEVLKAAPPGKVEEVCITSRPHRISVAQRDVRLWLGRVAAIKAACTLRTIPTGAFRVSGGRIDPETMLKASCPKGPPPGEDIASATSVLSLFVEGTAICVQKQDASLECDNPSDERPYLDLQRACASFDKRDGLPTLLPALNDMPELRATLAIPAPKPKK